MSVNAEALPALSLCELPARVADADRAGELARSGMGVSPQRIYIGSAFCPQLLCALSAGRVEALAERCAAARVPITLVVPIATQSWLERADAHALQLVDAGGGVIDEITVNDYGAFARWGRRISDGLGLRLNLGRLLVKDLRDPRDPDWSHLPCEPALLERDWAGWANIDRLCATWPVSGVELDPTHGVLDLSGLPDGVVAAVYGPLCFMSCGQICEFSGAGLPLRGKFRPNAPCELQCLRNAVRYTGASGIEFLKLGRTTYYRAPLSHVVGVPRYRSVFAPLEEVLG